MSLIASVSADSFCKKVLMVCGDIDSFYISKTDQQKFEMDPMSDKHYYRFIMLFNFNQPYENRKNSDVVFQG